MKKQGFNKNEKKGKNQKKKADKFRKSKQSNNYNDYDDDVYYGKKSSKNRNKRSEKYFKSNNRVDRFEELTGKDDGEVFEEDDEEEHTQPGKILNATEFIRLNKFIANAGICSRREADKYIKAGLVTINGKIITELGTKITKHDVVKFNNKTIHQEKNIYILLNKPKDFITTMNDPHASKTVLDLVKNACKERIYPVGRLDRNSTGVLLLTNDGDLTKRLTHPKFNKKKIYQVNLDKPLTKNDLLSIVDGLELDDGYVKADAVSYINEEDRRQIGIEIHSGKNRVIRRIFERLDYKVYKLDRVYFAGLTKKGLKRGKWRFLSDREISMLKMNAFK